MDVNSIRTSPGVSSAQNVRQTGSVAQNGAAQNVAQAAPASAVDEPYAVNISEQARTANEANSLKGLDEEQAETIKGGILKAQETMMSQMTASNVSAQISADSKPSGASSAAQDNDLSVGAVSGRIFDMAAEVANGDDERLERMRQAVEQGFERAGASFKEESGAEEMPKISRDTHAEIMKRFDDLSEQLAEKKTASDEAAVARLEKANL